LAFDPTGFPKVLTLYLELTQYPILAGRIREHMRREIFRSGVISQEAFEAEVREKAIQSQQREGLLDPLAQEPPEVWANRLAFVRDYLTDFYFAYNLPHERFAELMREILDKRLPSQDVVLAFHPELAPWDMLFAQGQAYEELPSTERARIEHHLKEIKVVLIKAMISDQLAYVGIAKEWFDIADLRQILDRRIGRGKIGGKAGGIVLAECILRKSNDPELRRRLRVPRSWFLGADAFYQFTSLNGTLSYVNQKYKPAAEIRAEYPSIRSAFRAGRFPDDTIEGLRRVLDQAAGQPLIVRSSSLLEDSFGTSFAGKYESYFCPNQGSPEDNLEQLLSAIRKVYASVYSPDVLLYRRQMELLDYDERMAVLIQQVAGRRWNRFYLPDAAGVAFSRNQFRWNPRIDRQAGFVRLVWGLGTRAVEQVGGDYPRLVALSHPTLRPDSDPQRIQRYSQRGVDLIDLQANSFRSLPVPEVIRADTPNLRLIAQRLEQGHLQDFVSLPLDLEPESVVLTFDGLLKRSSFAPLMRRLLQHLEQAYRTPVDVEFLLALDDVVGELTDLNIHLLQCRPQSRLASEDVTLPEKIPEAQRVFVTHRLVPDGYVKGIDWVVYVAPEPYRRLDPHGKAEVARMIGRLNSALAGRRFILIGPGRWGSINPELGIPVHYGDIYNARALVELVGDETASEPSYGTHFFQDLVESHIYPLAIALSDPDTEFNRTFFNSSPNGLEPLLPEARALDSVIRLISVAAVRKGSRLDLVMDGDRGIALAYMTPAGND
jgi:hypothetical protein